MEIDRRTFLQVAGVGTVAGLAAGRAEASADSEVAADCMGMLVDTTECIGCRKCEYACNEVNRLSSQTLAEFEDKSVFESARRPTATAYTVVNRYPNEQDPEKPIYVKTQCMHCLEPACASACLVGALRRQDNGMVTYDAGKCMGCRYCMVACPFGIPAYEYDNALTPQVRKCTLCFERVTKEGKIPACAEMCPPMCLTFGKRSDLLAVAREKIAAAPDRYHPEIYGEHVVGGTSFLYLAAKPFEQLGFLRLGDEPVPRLTETIQHSIFKFGLPPLMLFGLLGAAMAAFRPKDEKSEEESA
jgi:formate dehydrogenase iron-sulfur subunit